MGSLTLSPRLFENAGSRSWTAAGGSPAKPAPATTLHELPGGPTLDDVITAGWRQIRSGESASCPVCHGDLQPVWEAGSRPIAGEHPVGGRCHDCGSRLS